MNNFGTTSGSYESLREAMELATSDYDRTKVLIQEKYSEIDELLPYIANITDQYYRTQIIKAYYYRNEVQNAKIDVVEKELLDELREYNSELNYIKTLDDEKSKTEYISKIDNNDMKESLLNGISEKENRKIIINSLTRSVDPEIKSLDSLCQTMIREFFEDALDDDFTEEKRERLEIVFKRSDLKVAELKQNRNGVANHIHKRIMISNRHKNSVNKNIGFLVHEYAHLLSMYDYAHTKNATEHTIEEGMADTFSDVVINHYLEKHKEIIIDGEKIRIDKPYTMYSGYDFENAWVRTMLLGLESSGKDKEAIGEYTLGSKSEFTEMIFGKEIARTKERTVFDMPIIETNCEELYRSPELDFSSINENSIYYRRNHILPLYQIQNKMKDEEDMIGWLIRRRIYHANYIANKYFKGKRFYEISKEDLNKFMELLDLQTVPGDRKSPIIDIDEYKNELIDNLTEEEIKQFSFEILDDITVIWGNYRELKAGTVLENVIRCAFEEETKKIKEGQPLEIIQQKRDKLVQKYEEMFAVKNESNIYILDYTKDYDFACQKAEENFARQQAEDSLIEQQAKAKNKITRKELKKVAESAEIAQKQNIEEVIEITMKNNDQKNEDELGEK